MCNYDVMKCTWRELEFIVVIFFKTIFLSENFVIFSNLQKQKNKTHNQFQFQNWRYCG
jgi:hypothetical protein